MAKFRLVEAKLATPAGERVLAIFGPGHNELFDRDEKDMRIQVFSLSQRAVAEEVMRNLEEAWK